MLALMAACALLLAGCAARASDQKRDPNTLVALEIADAGQIDPLFANSEPEFLYAGFILDGLTGIGPNFSVIPWLATSWSHSPDGLHWNVNLRHGVTWSDGARFSSKDVVFTWKTMLDPKVGFPYAGQFAYVKDIVALGPYRVRFDLKNRNALFETSVLGSLILPEHVLGKIAPGQLRNSSFGQHPIGTGPYMLKHWEHDNQVIFVRNPHWWHGPAKISRIDIRIILDDQARVEAMENGSADLYDTMSPADYREIQQQDPGLKLLHIPDLFTYFMSTNLAAPGLSDLAVRKAMMYGWDRPTITDGLLHGDAQVSYGIVPPALKYWYDPHVGHYVYDASKARALLDASGWIVGGDGTRSKAGVPLAFELILPSGQLQYAEACAEFQADMHAIGITVAIKQLDYATFIQRMNDRKFELAFTGWGGTTDPDQFTFLDSTQLEPVGNNYTGYKNPIVDRDLV
ncbi:MAG: ABC transporter substrate-binding protein, partial [Vulcanimicrobiaceae bacterium]